MPVNPSSHRFPPARLAEHTVESLFAEHGPERAWTYWLLLAGVIGALASLPLIGVDVSVRAAGLVRPETERIQIRPAVSGHLVEILARDNERVRSGQPLLAIRSRDLEERLGRNQVRQIEQAELIGDLELLTTEPAMVTVKPSGDTAEKNDTAGPLSIPSPLHGGSVVKIPFKTPALQQDYAQYWAHQNSVSLAGRKASTELARAVLLEAKGIATRQELENARYEVERITAEARLLAEQTLARWQTRLHEERSALAALLSEAERLREEQLLYTLLAPADGQLLGFDGWSAGAFVSAGQPMGVLSPDNTLLIETWVSSRDVGLVRVGQNVRLQIDAFPYTEWGTLEGTVTAISGDLAEGGLRGTAASVAAFKVLVQPAATFVSLPNGTRGELRKGLTLSARFLVARRSVFQLLYEDASAWFDPGSGSPRRA